MSQDYHKCFSLSNKYAFLQILLRMCAELSAHMTVYARLGLRNLLSVENFSALAPAYPRLRQRNMLSVENFSAHAPVYARLRLKNLLPGINFSAHKTSYPPA